MIKNRLVYSSIAALIEDNETRHPQVVMRELEISYQFSVPRPVLDLWEFWNCSNIPKSLPSYIESKPADPMKRIGYGLSQEMAESIRDHQFPKDC